MAALPCYIKPEKLKELALEAAERLEHLSAGDVVAPGSLWLGPQGYFEYFIFEEGSIPAKLVKSVFAVDHFMSRQKRWTTSAFSRLQLLVALLGYSSFWLLPDHVFDEEGRSVPPAERLVFHPNDLFRFQAGELQHNKSPEAFKNFLEQLEPVPMLQCVVNWSPMLSNNSRRWRQKWYHYYHNRHVYEPARAALKSGRIEAQIKVEPLHNS